MNGSNATARSVFGQQPASKMLRANQPLCVAIFSRGWRQRRFAHRLVDIFTVVREIASSTIATKTTRRPISMFATLRQVRKCRVVVGCISLHQVAREAVFAVAEKS